MKHFTTLTWMLAIAIAGVTITACSSNDNETEKPFTTDPVENTLYACGVGQPETRSVADAQNMLFTEDDIEWFNVTTREIKFKDMDEPLYKRMQPFHEIEFHLGDYDLFVVSSFVGDWDSRTFTNLVLHYDVITDPNQGHYYLQDCYPLQFADTDEVKANREKNAAQWETFTSYLESIGKLRK
ncbi:MAG: hypothetical protein J6W75_11455 [Bacteroidaceae bacterium]|nr:hypothetical protein [Bacteroidaceae bacterium]